MTDMTSKDVAFLPCPFCGCTNISMGEGSSFRWRVAKCAECGAQCGEVRIQTMGEGNPSEWEVKAAASAIAEWNKRPTHETSDLTALRIEFEHADGGQMKRYRLIGVGEFRESPLGPWVRYEDIQQEIETLMQESHARSTELIALQTEFEHVRQERIQADALIGQLRDERDSLKREVEQLKQAIRLGEI